MRYLILLILLTSNICLGQISESDQELISSICEKYANCSTYQDSGYVVQTTTLTMRDPVYQSTHRDSFTTVFSREDAFRFSYNHYSHDDTTLIFKLIIHQDMDNPISTVYKKFKYKEPEVEKTHFLLSLASIVGITNGAGKFNLGLLLPIDEMNFNILKSKMGNLERIENEKYQEEDCYRFKQTYEFDSKMSRKIFPSPFKVKEINDGPDMVYIEKVSWFSKKDLLLKKVETSNRKKSSIIKTVIIYHPIMNENIDPQLLKPNFPEH